MAKNFFGYIIASFFSMTTVAAQITSSALAGTTTELAVQNEQKFIAGMQNLQLGKLEGAEKLFAEVYEADATCDACAHYLSRVNAGMNKPQVALDWAKKSIAADPKNKWYALWLAEMYEKLNQYKNATEVYQKLISAPNFSSDYAPELYYRLAQCYQTMGDLNNAVKTLDNLEKTDGTSEMLTEKKFALYIDLKDRKKAGEELKKLADAHPNTLEFQERAASYYEAIDEKATALTYFKRVLMLNPKNSKAILAQTVLNPSAASNAANAGNVNELTPFKTLFADANIALKEKVNVFLPYIQRISDGETKLVAPCTDAAQLILKTHPNEAQAFALLGDVLFYSGNYADALSQYNQCVARNKRIFSVWEHILYIEKNMGDWDGVLANIDRIQDNFPNENITYFYQAQALEKKARYKEANDALDQAILMSGNQNESKSVLFAEKGFIAAKEKNTDAVDAAFTEAMRLAPKSSWVLLKYANALQNRNDEANKKAAVLVKQATASLSEKDAAAFEEYGDYLYRIGNVAKAQDAWEKAARIAPPSSLLNRKIAEKKMVE